MLLKNNPSLRPARLVQPVVQSWEPKQLYVPRDRPDKMNLSKPAEVGAPLRAVIIRNPQLNQKISLDDNTMIDNL